MTIADKSTVDSAPPRARCARCKRGRIRLTIAGTFYAHKPYTRAFSGEMVAYCSGGGLTPRETREKVGST